VRRLGRGKLWANKAHHRDESRCGNLSKSRRAIEMFKAGRRRTYLVLISSVLANKGVPGRAGPPTPPARAGVSSLGEIACAPNTPKGPIKGDGGSSRATSNPRWTAGAETTKLMVRQTRQAPRLMVDAIERERGRGSRAGVARGRRWVQVLRAAAAGYSRPAFA